MFFCRVNQLRDQKKFQWPVKTVKTTQKFKNNSKFYQNVAIICDIIIFRNILSSPEAIQYPYFKSKIVSLAQRSKNLYNNNIQKTPNFIIKLQKTSH